MNRLNNSKDSWTRFGEIENLSVQMKHKLETEILPRIREQIEELRRRLEEIGKEEKLKYVDQKIETISAKL